MLLTKAFSLKNLVIAYLYKDSFKDLRIKLSIFKIY